MSSLARHETSLAFDIVISGGSLSAPAAALQAARCNPQARILLTEPTDWLGGQATSQGVSAIDNAWHEPGRSLMAGSPSLYYPADYLDFLGRTKAAPVGTGMAPNGSAWVTREAFDPRSAAWALDQMLAEMPNVTVMKMTVVSGVQSEPVRAATGAARKITSLTLIERSAAGGYKPFSQFLSREITDWFSPEPSEHFSKTVYQIVPRDSSRGLVVIDASETADVVVLSGATYTVGRELTAEEMGEDGSLPAMDETGSQATVYCFCMTSSDAPQSEDELKAPWSDFDVYYRQQLESYFSLGSHNWNKVWTYRRLLNTGALDSFDQVNRGDVTMQNWYPGNDYPYGSIYKDRQEAQAEVRAGEWRGGLDTGHLAQAEKLAYAWYFFMKEHRTTSWDTRMLRGDDGFNMMATATGLAKFPYIRCTRRIVGLENFRLTGRYLADSDQGAKTSYRFYDSVGIGDYAVDIHPVKSSSGIAPAFERAAPFYIPYRALGSANVRNLLAAGKLIATTYVTNAAYRLHPIEWAIGSAAGAAAALMSRDAKTNLELLEPLSLRELQESVQSNSPISWAAYDAKPFAERNGDLVVNDLKPVEEGVAFRVEVYHSCARRAQIHLGNELLGETTRRANGRLVIDGLKAPAGASGFSARCFDEAGNLIETLLE